MPCRDGVRIKTNIERIRHFGKTWFSVYYKERVVMVAKKNRNSNYIISINEDPNVESTALSRIAELRTISKNKFMLYCPANSSEKVSATSNVNRELAVVIYSDSRKIPRKINCILPEINKVNESVIQSPPTLGLLARYCIGETDQVIVLKNRLPRYDEKRNVWVLDFDGGRVTKPSVKNFQLLSTDGEENVTFQFGRIGNNTFTMDFGYPFTPVQAFGACLTSFAH